jgi:hypothetical protein
MKKDKYVLRKALFWVAFFSFLHSPNDKSIFHEKTLAHVACEDAHVNFFSLNFFNISSILKIKDLFKNKESISTPQPNITPGEGCLSTW